MTKYKATLYCDGAKTEINNLFDSISEARESVRKWLPGWLEGGARLEITAVEVEEGERGNA